MPIPASAVGSTLPTLSVTIERGRLQLFAKATGQTDPLYTDVEVARTEGHPDLPVPPSYLFGLDLEQPDPFRWVTDLGIDLSTVLHGSQSFTYTQLAFAGDTLASDSTITDVTVKKGGALELLTRRSEITRQGEPIATLEQVIVIRNVA